MENFSWMSLCETKILTVLLDNQLYGGLCVLKFRSLPLQERRTLWWTAGKKEAISWDIIAPLARWGKYQPWSPFLTSGRCSPMYKSGWMNAGARAGRAITVIYWQLMYCNVPTELYRETLSGDRWQNTDHSNWKGPEDMWRPTRCVFEVWTAGRA